MTQTATLEPTGSAIDLFNVFVKCPLCGSPDYQLLFAHKECGNVVRCTQCQLKFTRSRWTASMPELRQQHPEPLPDMILQKQDSQIDDFLDILNRIKRYQASGKLLELGCLTGHFLALARKAGYEGIGIEPDPWAGEYARREFGLSVHETPVPDLDFDDRTFDVIAMFHVMEHLTRPTETLLDLRRILTSSCTKQDSRSCTPSLPAVRIRLERIAWVLRKHTESFGRFLERAFKALHIQERTVHVNVRDNYRIYCRKAS